MRLSSMALATFASRHSSSWIDTLRKKKHANSTSSHSTPPNGDDTTQAPPLSAASSVTGPQDATLGEAGQACNESVVKNSPDEIALGVVRCTEREVGGYGAGTVQVNMFQGNI